MKEFFCEIFLTKSNLRNVVILTKEGSQQVAPESESLDKIKRKAFDKFVVIILYIWENKPLIVRPIYPN
ncbi:hypothetical protein EM308_03575 [Flavobacterium gilvum]|uniref:Uncharacterized protein n=1 Tax=Flavobacterium gilvum TaxID=1492737 RepID=A0AAC9N3E2_9FLAO|nr:hypothetical protein EM308_03575 [Flavobacterium gilvum]KFC57891.1 hypothetical protein FEM08_33190 [Flavobacterium gilvum]